MPVRQVVDPTCTLGDCLPIITGHLIGLRIVEGIEDPLGESTSLAAVLADLFIAAGLPVPTMIAERLGVTFTADPPPTEAS